MEFELSPQYTLSNTWHQQLTQSAEIVSKSERYRQFQFKREEKRIIVEIGVYEGASTCWWSDNLLDHPESQLYSIDPFTGSEEHHASESIRRLLPQLEATARRNIALSKNSSKVHVIKGCSWDVFPVLAQFLDQKVDILYIDGAHDAVSICRDSSLYYPLVKKGGLIIWDDFANPDCQRSISGVATLCCPLTDAAALHGQLWGIK